MAEIVTIGEILVEIMAKEVDQKFYETGEYMGPFPSGAPAIFTDQAAKCGSNAMIISAVGDDGFGKINLDRLKNSGVDVSSIRVSGHETTGVAFVTYEESGDRDFIYHIGNAACGKIDEEYVRESDFQDIKYLHIMGSAIYNEGIRAAILKAIDLAKEKEAKITFDPNVRKEIVKDEEGRKLLAHILKVSDIILSGENELFYLMGIEDERQCIEVLFNEGAETIIIKRGSRGATLFTKDVELTIPPYEVEEIDPTGAGDCFAGTFVSCINQDIDVVRSARLASIAGAMAVTKRGPMSGNTTLHELNKIYNKIYR